MLAEGGFATVYEAIDVRTKRAIAVKQIRCPDADHAARATFPKAAVGDGRRAEPRAVRSRPLGPVLALPVVPVAIDSRLARLEGDSAPVPGTNARKSPSETLR